MRVRRHRDGSGRFLTTILFVDIVGSTELAATIGDAAWRGLLGRYYAAVRDRLRRFGGRQIDTAGDGLFASFDAPADAVTCALAIRDTATELGVAIRAGLHMGEVQTIEGKVGGIAVHIGARIAAVAGPGEVLVSGTVKDLVQGSGLRFEDRGEADLKGVPGRWPLFLAQPPLAGGRSTGPPEPVSGAHVQPPQGRDAWGAVGRLYPRSPVVRGGLVAVVAIALVAVVGDLFLASGHGAPSPSPAAQVSPSASAVPPVPVAANSLGTLDPGTGTVVTDVGVGAQPSGIAVTADGSIWVTNTTAGTVSHIDRAATAVIQTIQDVGQDPTGIAVGDGAVWVVDSGGQQITRIDPATDTVVKTYVVGNAPSDVALDASGAVWVVDRLDGTLVRLDPASGKVTPYTVGLTPTDVAVGAGAVWVSDYDRGVVVRFDPQDGTVLPPVSVGHGASALAASDTSVWVANRLDDTVSHLDPVTNRVVGTISIGGEPTGVAIGPDAVWVAVASTSRVIKIDPSTNTIVGSILVAASPQAITMEGARPLFTAWAAPGNHFGGTLQIVTGTQSIPQPLDPTWDPDEGSLTSDGLVAFRQVGGPDGTQLVPDLATSVPTASPDGKTYVFQLHAGIRYSNGALLKASDVLRSAERATVAGTGDFGADVLDQQEVDSCTAAHCDLSAQIGVDDATGTVTFHLTKSDPYFLYDLVPLYIVPAGTPLARSTTPLPATGPYVVKSAADGEVVYTRNPAFQVWSPAAQPQGYPDEIDWREVADEPTALAEVESGQADWLADDLTGAQIDRLRTDLPARLNVAPSLKTWVEAMNTTMDPFDNLAVRRAVNEVVDRRAVAETYGGGVVTCQVVPPAFAGYQAYCPYTSDPDPSQTWRGPAESVAQAVETIKQAGMYAKPVTIWTSPDLPFENVQQYFTGLLRSLGFKVTSKSMPDAQLFGGDPASPLTDATAAKTAQMAGFWYLSSVPTAALEFPGSFTCAGFANGAYDGLRYPQQFCDTHVDALVQQAMFDEQSSDPATRATADQLWAEIDRAVVDDAPAVFAFNPSDVNFFSQRVGNFQHQPVSDVMVDQLWVQ